MWMSDRHGCRPTNGRKALGIRKIAWVDGLSRSNVVWFARCPLGATTLKDSLI